MNYEQIVDQFINERRQSARAEIIEYRRLPSLRHVIRDAALCHWMMQPGRRRHPHQWRIPDAALRRAERTLQLIANRLARSRDFETLHEEIAHAIGPIPKIGDLTVYDIAHRIGTYLGKSPRLVYLHRGTARGARHLGFTGATLDPTLLPPAFSRLSPEEIEDCLCIYKDELAELPMHGLRRSRCVPLHTPRRPVCGNGALTRHRSC